MKCKKILTALLAAACTMSGCHGDLDIMQDNKLSASNMWIDLGRIEGELIAVDGNAIYPIKASVFPLAIAQRADIRLRQPGLLCRISLQVASRHSRAYRVNGISIGLFGSGCP